MYLSERSLHCTWNDLFLELVTYDLCLDPRVFRQDLADGKENKRRMKEKSKKWNLAAKAHITSAVNEQNTVALI